MSANILTCPAFPESFRTTASTNLTVVDLSRCVTAAFVHDKNPPGCFGLSDGTEELLVPPVSVGYIL